VAGWTTTVRPPSSVTTQLKIEQLATGYAYKGDAATGDYEEDHLISLELGGSPSAVVNLWPEPYATAEGARVKDRVENKLHALVCNHSITLATAQHAIARNWWTAYLTYVGTNTAGSCSRRARQRGDRTVQRRNLLIRCPPPRRLLPPRWRPCVLQVGRKPTHSHVAWWAATLARPCRIRRGPCRLGTSARREPGQGRDIRSHRHPVV
jgi:hypothetical protein